MESIPKLASSLRPRACENCRRSDVTVGSHSVSSACIPTNPAHIRAVEAANAAGINNPYGVSEWDASGLKPIYDCKTVSCARPEEAVFSMEGRVESIREFNSKVFPGKKSGSLVVVEATHFWAREDAINDDRNLIDIKAVKPISRLGGISYGRTTQAFEIPRLDFEKDLGGPEGANKLNKQQEAKLANCLV